MKYFYQFVIVIWMVALVSIVQTGAWSGIMAQSGDILNITKWNEMIATFQHAILFSDEGINLGSSGTITGINFVGSGLMATRNGNMLTIADSGTIIGGTNTQLQYNRNGILGGATGALIDTNGFLILHNPSSTTPAVPSSSGAVVYSLNRAGRSTLTTISSNGFITEMQASIASRKIGYWKPLGNSTTITTISFGNTTVGTVTTRNVATTNHFTGFSRVGLVTNTAAGSSAGTRNNVAQYFAGNAITKGGYLYIARFGISHAAAVAQARAFIGLYSVPLVMGNANPSTLLNIVGIGFDSAGTTWNFIHNNGAGTATVVSAGAGFPSNTLSTDMYELRIYCPPESTIIYMSLENLRTNTVANYTATTKTPAVNTLLSPQIWINNGTTAAAAAIDVASQYIETNY